MIYISSSQGRAVAWSDEPPDRVDYFVIDAIPTPPANNMTLMCDLGSEEVWWAENPTPPPDPIELIQKDNTLLRAELSLANAQIEMLNDCLAEVAAMVYP